MGNSFTLTLQLDGLPADAILEVELPAEAQSFALDDLLEWVFPSHEEGQALVQDSFDLEENPDLPEIYESFLAVMEQRRSGFMPDRSDGAIPRRNARGGDCGPLLRRRQSWKLLLVLPCC